MFLEVLGSVLVATLSSLIGAFAGGGASLVMLPLLGIFLPGTYAQHLAITKTSATVLCATSSKIHSKYRKFSWKLLNVLIFSGLVGTAIGTYFVQYQFNEKLFKILLAVVLVITALYLANSEKKGLSSKNHRLLTKNSLCVAGIFSLIVSIFNGLFGGAGIFITTFLVIYFRFSFIQATFYAMITYTIVNIFQSGYLLFTEKPLLILLISAICGSFIGSFLGTKLQYFKGNLWVKRAAIVVMLLISGYLFVNFF